MRMMLIAALAFMATPALASYQSYTVSHAIEFKTPTADSALTLVLTNDGQEGGNCRATWGLAVQIGTVQQLIAPQEKIAQPWPIGSARKISFDNGPPVLVRCTATKLEVKSELPLRSNQ